MKKDRKNHCKFGAGQEASKNPTKINFGRVLGGVWGRLGPPLGAFGRLLAASWTFKIELLSSIGPKWAPRGLLDGFWIDFGKDLGGFRKNLGGFGVAVGHLGYNLVSKIAPPTSSLNERV